MIYEQLYTFTVSMELQHSETGDENVNYDAFFPKGFAVKLIHCYTSISWKMNQNFAATKAIKDTKTNGMIEVQMGSFRHTAFNYGRRLCGQKDTYPQSFKSSMISITAHRWVLR